jgi:hypothetical protein
MAFDPCKNRAKIGYARRLSRKGWSVGDIASLCELTKAQVRAIVSPPSAMLMPPPPPVQPAMPPPPPLQPAPGHAFEHHQCRWARWLSSFGLSAAHVALVMGLSEAELAVLLAKRMRRFRSDRAPALIPVLRSRDVRKSLGRFAVKIRRLAELGYDVETIGRIMRVPADVIAGFLDRDRRRNEPRPARPPKPPKPENPWKRSSALNDSAGWNPPPSPPPAIAAAELVDDLVNVELPAAPAETPPVDGAAWGHFQHRFASGAAHGRSKLTQANVDEARELRAAGWSTGRLAERYGVSRNTIAYALNGTTWQDA